MRNISTELDRIIEQLSAATDLTEPGNRTARDYFLFELRKTGYPLVVYDFKQPALLFLSEQVLQWLGETQPRSHTELLHRSGCSKETGDYILHFSNHPQNDLCNSLRLLKSDGTPLLLYGCSRCISFDDGGKAHLVITLLWPVDHLLQLALQNGTAQPPTLSDDELKRFQSLSPRELEVMKLMLNNKSDMEISAELTITCDTIRTHRSNLLSKLNLKTVAALHRFAGLV
jgi:DNA-binding CsgD family transcriptional regulator